MGAHTSGAETAPARHRAGHERRRRLGPAPVTLLVVVALVVGGGVVYLSMRGPSGAAAADDCPGPSIRVAATPEVVAVVKAAVADAGCDQIEVGRAAPARVHQQVTAGKDVPDVWIPDSSVWTARAAASAPIVPRVLLRSLAGSPIVLVSAGRAPAATWSRALADGDWVMGDPLTSVAATAPVLAGGVEVGPERTAELVVPLAQAQADARDDAPSDSERLAELLRTGAGTTSASEQRYLQEAPALQAAVPRAGTLFLDYPVLLTTGEDRRADIEATTQRLVEILGSADTRAALREAGFRGPDGKPPTGGVADPRPIEVGRGEVSKALQRWATLALPTRALAVIDVSGSMDFDAGGQTRMQLTTAATGAGLGLFPDTAAIGLWAFSHQLDSDSDHRELLPIRRLGAQVGGGTHRDALAAALGSLGELTGGATGLYDTTLAAYQEVVSGYDPRAVNSVLLFTDGSNDDPGSINLPELLDRLHELADPARPVRIIAIGISADADAAALRRIARATGGDAYVAERPQDMATVFREALGSRAG